MTSCWAAPRPWAWENNNNALFSGGIWDGKGSNGVSYGGLQQDVVIGSSSQCYMEAGKQSNEQPQQQQQQQEEEGNLNRASSDAMGLKLGKRTYFEDPAPKGPAAAACPALVTVPVVRKKQRAAAQPAAPPTCQVEGCNTDLTGSKAYHRRHRVCEVHSKTPKNIVDGIQQRFCQQCSRFHVLAEFDDDKRSCRRRLAGHNERRRKPPQPEPFTLPPGASIFPGPMKAFMPQQYQQHLLNGAFGSWPCHAGLHKFKEDPQIQHARTPILINASSAGTDSLHFHAQNRALQASIANEGIYQFFKSGASGGNGQASVSMSMPAEPGVIVTPVCNGALSLLSAGPWGSAPFIQPSSAAGNVKTISADYGSW